MKKIVLIFAFLLLLMLSSCSSVKNDDDVVIGSNIDAQASNNESIHLEDSNISNNKSDTIDDVKKETNTVSHDIEESCFEITFLDVGQGDSSIVNCDGHYMLIDGGSPKCSSLLYAYLKSRDINYFDYVICTHPDDDHIGGISGALSYADFGEVMCSNERDIKSYENIKKVVEEKEKSIMFPKEGDSFRLGSSIVNILSSNLGEDNDSSIVCVIHYGKNSFMFTGDASTVVEDILIKEYPKQDVDVLKVAHHGSSNATSREFLSTIKPEYAIISVGIDNDYDHPSIDTLSNIKDNNIILYRTDINGDIICSSDGTQLSFAVEKGENKDNFVELSKFLEEQAKSEEESTLESKYCINIKSGVFHYSYCSSVDDMADKNKNYTNQDRNEIIEMGYRPCKRCNP